MPTPGDALRPLLPAEDAFLDLLVETLESVEPPARGQFLQRFFKTIAQVDLTESQSLEFWDQVLTKRRELAASLGRPISYKVAIVDVLASSNRLRMPILMEYEDLKKLQINAATDPLTGLYNRRLFEEYFEKELTRAKRYNHPLSLVVMDLNRFKDVNDRHGHLKGDEVLRAVTSTLRNSLRTSDYAFRIGGDEFALLLPESDLEPATALTRRVLAHIDSAIEPLGIEVPLGCDYGIAVHPSDGDQKEVLMRVADERLYQHKQATRAPVAAPPAPSPRPAAERPAVAAAKAGAASASTGARAAPSWAGAERRKWERVSLAGTRASVELAETPEKSARVLDLGYGGVAIQTESPEHLTDSFHAVLHVPILPPVRVSLRRLYVVRSGGRVRVGCAFIS